jgi:hypothetical protein
MRRIQATIFCLEASDGFQGDLKSRTSSHRGSLRYRHTLLVEDDAKPYDYRITIAEGVATLLENGSWVALSGPVREALASDPLARGLHAHFASNDKVHATLAETLKGQMGRIGELDRTEATDREEDIDKTGMQPRKWLHALKRSLARVQAATGWSQCELVTAGRFAGKVQVRKGNVRRRPEQKTR